MSIGTILLIVLVIILLGGFSGFGGGPFYGTGYYGGGELGFAIVILDLDLDLARQDLSESGLAARWLPPATPRMFDG